jgi:hypothetical protein
MPSGNKDAHNRHCHERDISASVIGIWINPKYSPENDHIYLHLDFWIYPNLGQPALEAVQLTFSRRLELNFRRRRLNYRMLQAP